MTAHHDRRMSRRSHFFPLRQPIFSVLALLPLIAHGAVSLGDADIRSFLGQPLDVRLSIRAERSDWLDTSCISVRLGERELVTVPPGQLRLQESLDSRTLIVRSLDDIVAPYLTLELTVRCAENAAPLTRTYDLAIPGLQPPAVLMNRAAASPATADAAAAGGRGGMSSQRGSSPGRGLWITGQADTLDGIARGIYPRSAKMRAAFISRIRAANPDLMLPADRERLGAGLRLRLPDLIALANESPRLDPGIDSFASSAQAPRSKVGDGLSARAEPIPPTVPTETKQPAAKASAATDKPQPKVAAPAAEKKPVLARTAPSGGGFALRLSGVEMDLSRSRGVSEATRAALRDKQMLLDADDQVAALLALRNTVKQLEGRLNEMQLKLSTGTLPAPSAKSEPVTKPAEPDKASAVPSGPVTQAAPAAPSSPPATSLGSPAPAAKPAPSAAPPVEAKSAAPAVPSALPMPTTTASKTASSTTPVVEESGGFVWSSPWVLGPAALVALLAGWLGWRGLRRRRESSAALEETQSPGPATAARDRATSDLNGPSSDDFPASDWDDDASFQTASDSAFRSGPPSAGLQSKLREAAHHETVRMHAKPPELLDAEAAALELDTRPATSVDFMLGDDGGEDKSRRQRYMEERFPELAHHSISVDEPDSIIDAARHHYEEGQLQKAIELLTYAFEERPGQLRFWLALFEIHRLEQRAGDFAELAARFKNVHGGTDAWPKVQHIGRDLDPGQPLYSAALGRLGVPMDADFDPMSENWLNVPMDFTSDVLMIELRHSLMAEHVVLDDELRRPLIEVSA